MQFFPSNNSSYMPISDNAKSPDNSFIFIPTFNNHILLIFRFISIYQISPFLHFNLPSLTHIFMISCSNSRATLKKIMLQGYLVAQSAKHSTLDLSSVHDAKVRRYQALCCTALRAQGGNLHGILSLPLLPLHQLSL